MYEDEKGRSADRIFHQRKHHGKWEHVLDMQAFIDWIHFPEALNNIYHPSILHEIAADGGDDSIVVRRIRGKHKPEVMPLRLIRTSDGRAYWIRLDNIGEIIMSVSKTLILSCLKLLLPSDVLDNGL